MTPYGRAPVHYPCESSNVRETECFLVEGDSAAKSVDQVRDRDFQAILALQGKPLNAVRASRKSVLTNEVLIRTTEAILNQTLKTTSPSDFFAKLADPRQCVYDRIVLLMDPDADGIHCSVLMMGFLRRFASGLIEEGRVHLIRPPMYVFRFPEKTIPASQSPTASSPDHAAAIEKVLEARGLTNFKKIKYRGLGSLDASILHRVCVDPQSRHADQLTTIEADQAIRLFGGNRP